MRAICVMVRAENKTKEKVGIRHIWMLLVAQQINGTRSISGSRPALTMNTCRVHVITDGLRELWKKEYEKYKDMVQEKVIL